MINPPPKQKQKRFNTPEEITTMIDRLRTLIKKRHARADDLDGQADHLFAECEKQYDWDLQSKARVLRHKAARLRLMRNGTEERLKGLGHRLSELNTPPLPGLLPDGSIPQ